MKQFEKDDLLNTRPNINDEKYKFPHCENEIEKYLEFIDDLQNYCDKLEKKIEENIVAWDDLRKEYLDLAKSISTYRTLEMEKTLIAHTGYVLIEVMGEYEDELKCIIGFSMDIAKIQQIKDECEKQERKYRNDIESGKKSDEWYAPATYYIQEIAVYD